MDRNRAEENVSGFRASQGYRPVPDRARDETGRIARDKAQLPHRLDALAKTIGTERNAAGPESKVEQILDLSRVFRGLRHQFEHPAPDSAQHSPASFRTVHRDPAPRAGAGGDTMPARGGQTRRSRNEAMRCNRPLSGETAARTPIRSRNPPGRPASDERKVSRGVGRESGLSRSCRKFARDSRLAFSTDPHRVSVSSSNPARRLSMETVIGVIGGSGIYDVEGLEDAEWQSVETPWGDPSDQIFCGHLSGLRMAFLPRHGRGHVHSPSSVPYRANIDALKRLGVTDIVSASACGSFRDEMAPGDFVIVDQYIDRTFAREKSFFGTGCVAHVSVANPTCERLGDILAAAAEEAGIRTHRGGTYLAMEGPQFSTLAESRLYRENWGCDVIGMTNMPEAKLAREAEICYATVAMVTDYDSWHPDHGEVEVSEIIRTLLGNADRLRGLVASLPARVNRNRASCRQGCDRALDNAIITQPANRDPSVVARLDAVAGRVLR